MALQPGQKFDRYTVEELVGQGGMGRVYRAFDTRLQRTVALKVLHAVEGSGDDAADAVALSLREARAAAAIAHPNATAVYDADEVDGTSFLAMEFVSGRSLRVLLGGSPIPLATRLRWLIDIAGALDAAHRMGVVHRDVKPENVMVRDDGLVKVLDFGVARRATIEVLGSAGDASGPSGSSGSSGPRIAGTPAYMSPEQIRGEPVDGRTDQFGWGVLGYEMLTGQLPWRSARTILGCIAAVLSENPAPPSELRTGIPPAVDAAVLRALAKLPADRFATMRAAAQPFLRYARGSLSMVAVPLLTADGSYPAEPESDPSSADPASDPTVLFSDLDGEVSRARPAAAYPLSSPMGDLPVSSGSLAEGTSPHAYTPVTPVTSVASVTPVTSASPFPVVLPASLGTLVSENVRARPAASSPRSAPAEAPPQSSSRTGPPSPAPQSPVPQSSGARARGVAAAATRPRRPFGPGFHDPDFECPVDLDAHLALVPPGATVKGLFFGDLLVQACKVTTEREVFRLAQISPQRYVGFRDYPLGESLRLTVAAARVLYPRYTLGEALRRVGQTVFDAVLATHLGRALFGVLGRDVEPVLLAGPKAYALLVSVGEVKAEKSAFRTFTFHASGLPTFLETYHVGVLEGVLRHCGERGRIRIAMEDLSRSTIELHLL